MTRKCPSGQKKQFLEASHRNLGAILFACNRLISMIVVLGGFFILMTLAALHLAGSPEKSLQMQAYMFNYLEFSQPAGTSRAQIASAVMAPEASATIRDPNWDGTAAGLAAGFTMGRQIPFVGVFIGPIAGAIVGYRMDSRI